MEPLLEILQPTRRPKGKVAKLPRKVRQQLNLLLADGLEYAEVLQALGEPVKHLNADNVRRWHNGAYQKWLKDQLWLEELAARVDFAAEVLQDPESPKIREASLAITIKQMYELLATFDPISFREKLADDPAAYSRLISALAKLAEVGLRYDDQHSESTRTAARQTASSKKSAGLTEELLRQYETEFNLLRRPPLAAVTQPENPPHTPESGSQQQSTASNGV
ncbi:MAG TPA: hypothetical protein VLT36_12890 [Candidatus Dormibacteraeota bacterium]|nr:hypothetical protein [Candidatus Dormibacteraeota bacterium]